MNKININDTKYLEKIYCNTARQTRTIFKVLRIGNLVTFYIFFLITRRREEIASLYKAMLIYLSDSNQTALTSIFIRVIWKLKKFKNFC